MSYILRNNDYSFSGEPFENYYIPSESLKNLFRDMVTRPFKRQLPSLAKEMEEGRFGRINDKRKLLLEQGQTNFDQPTEGFSPEEKVIFYCVNYMPMHLYSSYHLFSRKLFLPASPKVVFVDFGCGPLTSGIAFWTVARECDLIYIGIDSSQTMLDFAQRINQYGPNCSESRNESFYKDDKLFFLRDYNHLPQLLDDIIKKSDNSGDTLIIFNFCYFLQSKTFNESDIEELGTLIDSAGGFLNARICVVYQDPEKREFQRRWYNLKSWAIPYPSAFNVSGYKWMDPTDIFQIKYDTLWQEQNKVKVSYDIFDNFHFKGLTL